MKRNHYSEEQIIEILNEHTAGLPANEVIRTHGIANGTFYRKLDISVTEFNTLETVTLALYPMLKIFIGWTRQGQNLKCQILKKRMMLEGVDD